MTAITTDHAIVVRGANKRYGDFVALDNVDFDRAHWFTDGIAGTQRFGQVDPVARHRRARPPGQRDDHDQRP